MMILRGATMCGVPERHQEWASQPQQVLTLKTWPIMYGTIPLGLALVRFRVRLEFTGSGQQFCLVKFGASCSTAIMCNDVTKAAICIVTDVNRLLSSCFLSPNSPPFASPLLLT